MEPPFEKLKGVYTVVSGYSGGKEVNPTYNEVAGGRTGHTEVVQVTYDPAQITYEALLEVFWRSMDPTDNGGQFADRGSQYRPAIFTHGPDQAEARGKRVTLLKNARCLASRSLSKLRRSVLSTQLRAIIRTTTRRSLGVTRLIDEAQAGRRSLSASGERSRRPRQNAALCVGYLR